MSDINININKYFSSTDIPLVLYYIFFNYINSSTNDDNNVVCFQFSDYDKMIKWIKNGTIYTGVTLDFLNLTSDMIPEKYRDTFRKSKEDFNKLCIITTCSYDEKREIWCSIIVIDKIVDVNSFDNLKSQYKKHISNLYYIL